MDGLKVDDGAVAQALQGGSQPPGDEGQDGGSPPSGMEEPNTSSSDSDITDSNNEDQGGVDNDDQGQESDPPTDKREDDTKVPWDKDPRWKVWRESEAEFEKLREKLGNKNIDDLLEKAKSYDDWQEYYEEQEAKEEAERIANESKDEKIARLEQQMREADTIKEKKQWEQKYIAELQKQQQEQVDASQKRLKEYDSHVKDNIKELENIVPDGFKVSLKSIIDDVAIAKNIDITSEKAVKAVISEVTKGIEGLRQHFVQQYIDGKLKVPPKGTGDGTPVTGATKPKNITEAGALAFEMLSGLKK